jgi:hypothetical protein
MREVEELTGPELQSLKAGNYALVECTAEELRAYLDGEMDAFEEVEHIFDAAQGAVFSKEAESALIVIRVVADTGEEGDDDEVEEEDEGEEEDGEELDEGEEDNGGKAA